MNASTITPKWTFLALLLALVAAAPVDVTHRAKVERSVDAGEAYWRARDVEPCPARALRVIVTRLPADWSGAAPLGGCVVWLDRVARWAMTDREDCALMAHELGHTAGLEHSASGLMSPTGGDVVPWRCRRAFPPGSY